MEQGPDRMRFPAPSSCGRASVRFCFSLLHTLKVPGPDRASDSFSALHPHPHTPATSRSRRHQRCGTSGVDARITRRRGPTRRKVAWVLARSFSMREGAYTSFSSHTALILATKPQFSSALGMWRRNQGDRCSPGRPSCRRCRFGHRRLCFTTGSFDLRSRNPLDARAQSLHPFYFRLNLPGWHWAVVDMASASVRSTGIHTTRPHGAVPSLL